jgi:plasmid stabilization system protein ParE
MEVERLMTDSSIPAAVGKGPTEGPTGRPELARLGMRTWREIVARPYRRIYRIEGNTVNVLAAFDGRRDLANPELLLQIIMII